MRRVVLGVLVPLLAALALYSWASLRSARRSTDGVVASTLQANSPVEARPKPELVEVPPEPEEPAPEPKPLAAEAALSPKPNPTPPPSAGDREAIEREVKRLQGRVVDRKAGGPVANVPIYLQSAGADDLALTLSNEQGTFFFEDWEGDARAVVAESIEGWIIDEPQIELFGPPSGAGVLVFEARPWPPPIAGNISGRLRSESGPWAEGAMPNPGRIVLDLVSVGTPRINLRADLVPGTGPDEGTLTFLFEDVPEGEYELTLSALESYRWSPRAIAVTPPAEGIEFLRFDGDEALPLVFKVFDSKSEEPIESFRTAHLQQTVSGENGVFMHAGPLESQRFPIDAKYRWSLWADGYAPAFGNESAFRREEGKLVAEVYLERGWSHRFVVLGPDPTMRPLAGARILLDGQSVGETGDDGSLTVAREEAPESVAVVFRDWVLENDPSNPSPGTTDIVRGYTTALVVRPPGDD